MARHIQGRGPQILGGFVYLPPSKFGVGQVQEVHALEIIVHHELEDVRDVRFVRLEMALHDAAVLEHGRRPLNHERIVEEDLEEAMLSRMVAVEGHTAHFLNLVDVLSLDLAGIEQKKRKFWRAWIWRKLSKKEEIWKAWIWRKISKKEEIWRISNLKQVRKK